MCPNYYMRPFKKGPPWMLRVRAGQGTDFEFHEKACWQATECFIPAKNKAIISHIDS